MSQPQHQAQLPHESQPKRNRERPRQRNKRDFLASATIFPNQTPVIAADIYNEPVRTSRNINSVFGQYVPFLDEQNSYAKLLISVIQNSPTLRRVINDKVNMTIGDGFNVYKGAVNPMLSFMRQTKQKLSVNDKVSLDINNALVNVNLNSETIQDVMFKSITDYWSLGNAFIELVKVQTSEGLKTYIYHIPVYMVAFKKMEEDLILREVGVYETWEKDITSLSEIRNVAIYPNVTQEVEEDGTVSERTMIVLRRYSPGYSYWGQPDWIAGKAAAELEYRAARYNINEFENGFIPSAIVQFFGTMSDDEANDTLRKFKDSYTGTKNHKKVFAQVVRDESNKVNVQTLDAEKQGNYIDLLNLCAQYIVSASGWSMAASGWSTSGQLGSNQQLKDEMINLQNKVINPVQNLFEQNVLQPYLTWMSETDSAFTDISLEFSNSTPVSFLGDVVISDILTIDEQRAIAGFAPLTPDQRTELDNRNKVAQNTMP